MGDFWGGIFIVGGWSGIGLGFISPSNSVQLWGVVINDNKKAMYIMFEIIVDFLGTILSAIGWKNIDKEDDATSWKIKL